MNKIISVDCDLVLAQSDKAWNQWLQNVTLSEDKLPKQERGLEYNISKYYEEELEFFDRDGMDFWRSTSAFDYVKPVPLSAECIADMSELGANFVVVSHIKGNSNKSKYQFLQRHFPSIKAYVATKEKWAVGRALIAIDDRVTYLKDMDAEHKILFYTPYIQDEEPTEDMIIMSHWAQIVNFYREITGE